jgi:hypothetical protein
MSIKVIGKSKINQHLYYFVNEKGGITVCHKDLSRRPSDLEGEKIFGDIRSAEKIKKTLKSWREDLIWVLDKS